MHNYLSLNLHICILAHLHIMFQNRVTQLFTVIIQPVRIGKGCNISNSIIGPNVTVGEDTTIESSIVKNSIIGSFSNLFDIVLDFSIIGSDTGIHGETRTLNIGDNTDINLG